MKSIALRQWEAAAYAAGRLTQIRRVLKGSTEFAGPYNPAYLEAHKGSEGWSKIGPYGAPGDTLALREGFALVPVSAYRCSEGVAQTANPDSETYQAAIYLAGFDRSHGGIEWHRSARMPLWAVRWHPVITAGRLERVQDMTEADARGVRSKA